MSQECTTLANVELNLVSEKQGNGESERVTFRNRHWCTWWMAGSVAVPWQQAGYTQN